MHGGDSVSTTCVVPCGTWAAYHPWRRDVYLKRTCNLQSAHAVSETATPLGQQELKSVDVKKFCCEKTETVTRNCNAKQKETFLFFFNS